MALLPRIVDFALQGENQLNRVAVVMDVRGVRSIEKLQEALTDWSTGKQLLLSLAVGAAAAGFSAVYNGIVRPRLGGE